jgi:hypothetical protein
MAMGPGIEWLVMKEENVWQAKMTVRRDAVRHQSQPQIVLAAGQALSSVACESGWFGSRSGGKP